MRRRVVITGLGALTPLGNNVEETWAGVIQGRSGIGRITAFDARTFPVQIAGEIKNFQPANVPLPEDCALFIGRSAQLCFNAAQQALADAGIDLQRANPRQMGISLGGHEEYIPLTMLPHFFCRDELREAYQNPEQAHAKLLARSCETGKLFAFRKRADMVTAALAVMLHIEGPVATSHTACSSSGHAIGKAKRMIENGECSVVIAGGHCSMLNEHTVAGFHLLGTLSTRNDEPHRASRPFDRSRDGFVMGEGAGILILEERAAAQKRGARIYAELSGYGSSSNAYRITDSPPDGSGGDLCMQRALADAQKNITDIDYINAHGTATILNDRSETQAIKKVFGEQAYKIPVSSTKSMIGHLVTASSAVELIITCLVLRNNIIHPTINLDHPDPACDLDYVPHSAREQRVRAALSNSFAFGGQNVTLIVEHGKG
jgi:3-oxoacyl-[acyl-carrier-protein] synthase II